MSNPTGDALNHAPQPRPPMPRWLIVLIAVLVVLMIFYFLGVRVLVRA